MELPPQPTDADMQKFLELPQFDDADLEDELYALVGQENPNKKKAPPKPAKKAPAQAKQQPGQPKKNPNAAKNPAQPPQQGNGQGLTPEQYQEVMNKQEEYNKQLAELENIDVDNLDFDDIELDDDELKQLEMAADNDGELPVAEHKRPIAPQNPPQPQQAPAKPAKPANPAKPAPIKAAQAVQEDTDDEQDEEPAPKVKPASPKSKADQIPEARIQIVEKKQEKTSKKRQQIRVHGNDANAGRKTIKQDKVGEVKTYEELFNYFAANVFNYLQFCDEEQTANTYMDRIEKLVTTVLDGPEATFEPFRKIQMPKSVPPFALWSNISKKPIKVVSALQNQGNYTKILNEDYDKLKSFSQQLRKQNDNEQAQMLDQAASEVKTSLHNLTTPPILTTNVVTWKLLAINSDINQDEVCVAINDIKNPPKGSYRFTIQIPTMKNPIIINSTQLTTSFTNKGLRAQNAVKKWGNEDATLTIELDYSSKKPQQLGPAKFTLFPLLSDCTIKTDVSIGTSTINVEVRINKPLSTPKYNIFTYEYHVSPLVVTENIKMDVGAGKPPPTRRSFVNLESPSRPNSNPTPTPQPKPKPSANAKPIQQPNASPNNKPRPQPKTKQRPHPKIQIPEIRIYTDEEINQFWPLPIIEWLINQSKALISMMTSQKVEIPPTIPAQLAKFENKYKQLEDDVTSGKMTQEQYIQNIVQAIKREQNLIPHTDPKFKDQAVLFIDMMKKHYNEVKG